MKAKTKTDDAPLCREEYVVAKGPVTCDGCGEEHMIDKGMTYMRHVMADGSAMNLCCRCIFALKFRLASTGRAFDFGPGDLAFDKLPNRYKSAWTQHRKRFTKDIQSGMKPEEAWKKSCNRLIDDLGMRHVYERDLALNEQARKFDRRLAGLKKRIKETRKQIDDAILAMAKARLELKVIIERHGGLSDADNAMEELVAAMASVREAWEKI